MIMKLKDIFELQMGKTPSRSKDEYWHTGEFDFISISDLNSYEKYVGKTKEKISELSIKKSAMKAVPPHTVIMSFKLSLGKTAITVKPVYTNEAIMAFIDNKKEQINIDYIYHLFSAMDWSVHTNRTAMGITLNKNTLLNTEIFLPVLEEQKKIAANLDKISSLISLRKQQIEKLDLLVKSRFIEMFGDLVINNKNWDVYKLEKFITIVHGYAFKSENFKNEGIPILRIGNINSGYFKQINMVYWIEDDNLKKYLIKPGDLVISLTGTVGKEDYGNVCIMKNEYNKYYLNQRNAKIEVKEQLNQFYIAYVLKIAEIKKRLTGINRGVRQGNISNKDIQNLVLPIPPIDLQNQFAHFVQYIENQKFTIWQSLDKLEILKKALRQEYFN